MNRWQFRGRVLSIGLATAFAAGCGSHDSGLAATPAAPSIAQAARSESGSNGDLLYVSDVDSEDVYVFSYPSGNLVQTITGFTSPGSLCADGSGNVYVPDTYAAVVYEFAHGGTSPINTLQLSGRPSGCWVDQATGDLAVTNINSFVSIYKHAKGSPTNYSTQTSAVFCSYDGNGNLYVVEPGQLSTGMVVEMLPKGGTSFERVTFDKFLGTEWPAGIQWFRNHLVVAKGGPTGYGCCGRIFRFSVTGTTATHTGSYKTAHNIADIFIYKSTLIASTLNDYIQLYNYPKIRKPTGSIAEPGRGSNGVVISVAPPH